MAGTADIIVKLMRGQRKTGQELEWACCGGYLGLQALCYGMQTPLCIICCTLYLLPRCCTHGKSSDNKHVSSAP